MNKDAGVDHHPCRVIKMILNHYLGGGKNKKRPENLKSIINMYICSIIKKPIMKKLIFIGVIVLLFSLNSSASDAPGNERSIGFAAGMPDAKFHLGTEAAIQVVKDLDKAWAKKDFKAMKKFFVDTAKCYFADGRLAKSSTEFIEIERASMEGYEVSWTFDYAVSVDLDPTRGGEHVQAGFTVTAVKNGVTTKKHYHESYFIVDGKIAIWNQYAQIAQKD